jgi:hypothetical protein
MPTPSFRLIALTQYLENYGAHTWNGEGECPQYWKNKGGNEILVKVLSAQEAAELGQDGMQKLVDEYTKADGTGINYRNDYAQEYLIDWNLLAPGEETQQEKDEREWKEYYG